jgi:hypothetical protein
VPRWFSAIPNGNLFPECLVGFEKQTSVSDERFSYSGVLTPPATQSLIAQF